MARNNLEERLIAFSIRCIYFVETVKRNAAGVKLTDQLIGSSTSISLNYAESQGAESSRDFIHKLKVALKEARETHVNLKIIHGSKLSRNEGEAQSLITESNEIIAIFVAAINRAKMNAQVKLQK